jgi:hypothetical protein
LPTTILSKNPLYIVPPIVRIFGSKSRTRRTLGSHQIQVLCRRSEQLIGREPRRELEEALAHVLGAEASPEPTLTVTKQRPSRLIIAGLRCRLPLIKVSLIEFPSSLWSRMSKPHRKQTTMARENPNSGEPPCSAMVRRPWPEPTAPPSDLARTTEIRNRYTLSLDLIRAVELKIDGHHFMWSVDRCAGTPWARSTGP